jgi:hypothetical protein
MSFFKQFPKINYDLYDQNDLKLITDIYRHVDVKEIGIDPFVSYAYYEINEGDRPDNVSQQLYGSTDYYWTFFIINDALKEGLSAWPQSTLGLERYITQEYDQYSVLTFSPVSQGTASSQGITFSFVNTLNGVDMSHPYLRIRRYNDFQNSYARVSHYDSTMYQLYIYGVNQPDNFFADDGEFYIETFNPHQNGSNDFINVEALNNQWREDLFTYMEKENDSAHQTALIYLDFIGLTLANTSRIDYLKRYEKQIGGYGLNLRPTRMNRLGRNAPKEYLAADGSGEIISAYDALVTSSELDPYPYLNTYAEYEREKNLEKRKIRVVKRNVITQFVDAYKDLIQS